MFTPDEHRFQYTIAERGPEMVRVVHADDSQCVQINIPQELRSATAHLFARKPDRRERMEPAEAPVPACSDMPGCGCDLRCLELLSRDADTAVAVAASCTAGIADIVELMLARNQGVSTAHVCAIGQQNPARARRILHLRAALGDKTEPSEVFEKLSGIQCVAALMGRTPVSDKCPARHSLDGKFFEQANRAYSLPRELACGPYVFVTIDPASRLISVDQFRGDAVPINMNIWQKSLERRPDGIAYKHEIRGALIGDFGYLESCQMCAEMATHAMPNGTPKYCARHAPPNFTEDHMYRACSGGKCPEKATWSFAGAYPEKCVICSQETMLPGVARCRVLGCKFRATCGPSPAALMYCSDHTRAGYLNWRDVLSRVRAAVGNGGTFAAVVDCLA